MSRTLTAMFDSRAEAEAAKARLLHAHVDADRIHIVDQGSSGMTNTTGTATTSGTRDEGFWASLKNLFVSDDDRNAYGEGIRRGGYLLTADVEESEADQAVSILDDAGSVDFDARQEDWRRDGWTGGAYTAGGAMLDDSTLTTDRAAMSATAGRGQTVTEESIPVVEEELRVGKREVTRGGARVRSYVRETPVSEQVTLRDEHVSVERRPVDRALAAGEIDGDMLRDRTIEMSESHEEAVIGKEARVVEEVVVRKTSDTRVETVDDTVRRTEVDIEDPLQRVDRDRMRDDANAH